MGFDFSTLKDRQLTTERLILQPPNLRHALAICAYFRRNRVFLEPWSPRMRPVFYTEAFHLEKISPELVQMEEKRLVKFWLFKRADTGMERPIGQLSFSNLVWGAFRSTFLGYSMDFAETGHGYITEAIEAAVRFAFDELLLHRIEANIMPRNLPSIRVAEKLGFENEGLSPKYLKINGVWEDHLHYVIRNEALE